MSKISRTYTTFYLFFWVDKLSNNTVSVGFNSGQQTLGQSVAVNFPHSNAVPICLEFSEALNARIYVGVRYGPNNNIYY